MHSDSLGQAVRQADRGFLLGGPGLARRRRHDSTTGLLRDDDVAVALEPHAADVAQAPVLEQLGELGVAQGRLAQLQAEARAEEALEVGERDRLRVPAVSWPRPGDDLLEARLHRVPAGERARSPGRAGARALALGAPLLDHRLRAAVGHNSAVEVAEELLLRDGKLHNVADLAQRAALEEGHVAARQHLGAGVAPAGKHHVGVVEAAKVDLGRSPEVRRVDVRGAVDVHERRVAPPDQR
mmetsp:Transcript_68348/g.179198  ORF Transcript_68348/g.179198 Transcript_68348/m.179198 type:complete len:240 (+) Transcript_68348:808-1527(+)